MTNAVSIAQSGSNNTSFRNRIINGAMVIDQRNAGASVTPANGQYLVDRWSYSSTQNSKFTAQQNAGSVTPPTGFTNYLGMTVAAAVTVGAGDYFFVGQSIEGFNFADLGWGTANAKTITLSFQVYSSLTGTFGGVLTNSAQSRSYPFTYTISSANTWTSISVTIAGDTTGTWVGATNGTGVKVWFGLGVGSTNSGTAGAWAATQYISATGATSVVGTLNATWYVTGVQLEAGSTASPFENRSYGVELALCQRYYWKFGGGTLGGSFMPAVFMNAISTTNLSGCIQLPVRARLAPTSITLGGSAPSISGGTISTNMTLDRSSMDQVMTYITGSGFTAYNTYRWIGNSDALTYIEFLGMEL